MTRSSLILLAPLLLMAMAAQAQASCAAEYKAKRDTPFELHYDVAQIDGPCTMSNAETQLRKMLAREGLVLLKVLSVKES
jgi:hypothetical protein